MDANSTSEVTVFVARRIHTMDQARPQATHVAVRDGRILAVGSESEVASWGSHTLDSRFADQVLLPGFVEGHGHLIEGVQWRWTYCGYFDRTDPDGRVWKGLTSLNAVVERLRDTERSAPADGEPVVGFGFDPIYFAGSRCERGHLDQVSTTRSVVLMHASGHITNANTFALDRLGWMRPDMDQPGVMMGADSLPNGELRGPMAQGPMLTMARINVTGSTVDDAAIRAYGRVAAHGGVTTSTDLASQLGDSLIDQLLAATGDPEYPLRLVPALHVSAQPIDSLVDRVAHIRGRSTDKLRMGRVKAHADGSIQGFSARMRWPGYFNGSPQGLWYIEPERLREIFELGLRHGFQVHTHVNGDEAIAMAIECMAEALRTHPRLDHRFVLQHCQLVDRAQLRTMKTLGLCANLFANHHFFWGDAHYSTTVGPDRAERMNPCRSAGEIGVPFAIHSDAPVTPLRPLHVAWCAVNRLTASGRLLGAYERIAVADALHAVTLGAAYTLHLDGEIGSIECGKRADFAVLADDPFEIDPADLRDVRVTGTVFGGSPSPGGA